MDHLPTPADPAFPPVKVPWLGMPYDDKGFFDYPERMGWTKFNNEGQHYLLPDDDRKESDDKFKMAFHQSWLWLGLVVEVCKTYDLPFNSRDFTVPRLNILEPVPNGTTVYVTTERLPMYLEEMLRRDRSYPHEERRHRLSLVLTILKTALEYARCAASTSGMYYSLSDEIALSILVLGQTLQNAIRAMTADWFDFDEYAEDNTHDMKAAFKGFSFLNSKLLRNRLQSTRWCKSEVKLLEQYVDVEQVYYASMLQRHGSVKDHSQCSDTTCLAQQVHEGYRTRHINADCNCGHIGVDVSDVDRILQDGGIPAIKIFTGKDTKLEVVDVAADVVPYIAISHVWSDGLGNETANSLPRCQLQHLCEITSKIRPTRDRIETIEDTHEANDAYIKPSGKQVSIWIDTLCVPISSKRKLALKAIGRTFQRAKAVLVLDLELMNVSLSTRWQELCLRVGLSGWSRRLWTLQEAALAQNRMYFQFKEGSLDMWTKVLGSITCRPADKTFRTKADEVALTFFSRRARPHYEDESPATAFIWMAGSLLFRTTSKQIDEPFCLASILGFDTSEILGFELVEERMRELWKMQQVIPSGVFFQNSEKLGYPGFRWAPKSLLEPNSNPSSKWRGEGTTPMGRWDEGGRGVRIALPGFLITFRQLLVPDDNQTVFGVWVRRATALEEWCLIQLRSKEHWNQICNLEEVFLVVDSEPIFPWGFLASSRGEEGNTKFVNYLCAVNVRPMEDMIDWEWMKYAMGSWEADCTTEYGNDQEWCIG